MELVESAALGAAIETLLVDNDIGRSGELCKTISGKTVYQLEKMSDILSWVR